MMLYLNCVVKMPENEIALAKLEQAVLILQKENVEIFERLKSIDDRNHNKDLEDQALENKISKCVDWIEEQKEKPARRIDMGNLLIAAVVCVISAAGFLYSINQGAVGLSESDIIKIVEAVKK